MTTAKIIATSVSCFDGMLLPRFLEEPLSYVYIFQITLKLKLRDIVLVTFLYIHMESVKPYK